MNSKLLQTLIIAGAVLGLLAGYFALQRIRENRHTLATIPDSAILHGKIEEIQRFKSAATPQITLRLQVPLQIEGAQCQKQGAVVLAGCTTDSTPPIEFEVLQLNPPGVCEIEDPVSSRSDCIDKLATGYLYSYNDFSLLDDPDHLATAVESFLQASLYRNIPDSIVAVVRIDDVLFVISEEPPSESTKFSYQVYILKEKALVTVLFINAQDRDQVVRFIQLIHVVNLPQ